MSRAVEIEEVLRNIVDKWAEMHAVDAMEWADSDRVKIYVSIGDLRKAREILQNATE